MRQVPGAADTAIEQEEDQAQLRLRIDRQAVARYGINVRDVQDVIEMAIGGRAAGTMFEGERRFDITVRFQESARADAGAIANILIPTREGGRVPQLTVAQVKFIHDFLTATFNEANEPPELPEELLKTWTTY